MKHLNPFILLVALLLSVSCTETIEKNDIPITSISLSRNSIELVEGESISLTTTISPSDATYTKVSWSSSKSSVASVDQKGSVTALSVGSATITASAGGTSASCKVTVTAKTIAVSSITLDKTDLSLNVGEEYQLKATIEPSNASEQNVKWTSASSSIATVNDGLIKGVMVGETKITASIGGQSAVCTVKVSQIDYSKEYLTIELLSDGMIIYNGSDFSWETPIEISTDAVNWTVIRPTTYRTGRHYKKGDKVRIRGRNYRYALPYSDSNFNDFKGCSFTTSDGAKIKVYGNIMSLIDYDFENLDQFPTGCEYAFAGLFHHCEGLISAKDLILPKTTTRYCYAYMFSDCRNLMDGPSLPATALKVGCYKGMFSDCVNLTSSPSLPAKSLAQACYTAMFRGCTSLTTSPILPATELEESCYSSMFAHSGLVNSPDLPATTIPGGAYQNMFAWCKDLVTVGSIYPQIVLSTGSSHMQEMFCGCVSLKEIPDFSLTTTAKNSYRRMFYGCTSLTEAPKLSASTLSQSCYAEMFARCTSLYKAPDLPASVLANSCYSEMFSGCTSLVEVPVLPAMKLELSCYNNMFEGCSSLKTAPSLPATSITEKCYYRMFAECSSLTDAPSILPAMSLAERCYEEMFYNCRSLTTAPVLPATSLVRRSYYQMFFSCIRLNYVKAMFLDLPIEMEPGYGISTYWRTLNWLSGVAGEGTFVKNVSSKWGVSGVSGVPDGWVVDYANE